MKKNMNVRSENKRTVGLGSAEAMQQAIAKEYQKWERHGDGNCLRAIYKAAIGALERELRKGSFVVPAFYLDRILGGPEGERCSLQLIWDFRLDESTVCQATVVAMERMHQAWIKTGAEDYLPRTEVNQRHCFLAFELIGWNVAREYYLLLRTVLADLGKACDERMLKRTYASYCRKQYEACGIGCLEDLNKQVRYKAYSPYAGEALVKALSDHQTIAYNVEFALAEMRPYWSSHRKLLADMNARIARRAAARKGAFRYSAL